MCRRIFRFAREACVESTLYTSSLWNRSLSIKLKMLRFRSHFVFVLIATLAQVSGLQSVPPSRALEAAALARLEGLDPSALSSCASDTPVSPLPSVHAGYIVGVDEAGTGALAGPVVAAAVWLHPSFDQHAEMQRFVAANKQNGRNEQNELPPSPTPFQSPSVPGLRDSKLLKPAERLAWVEALRNSRALAWATAAVPAVRTDVIGVAAANAEALELAVARLSKQLQRRTSLDAMTRTAPTRTSATAVDENGIGSTARMNGGGGVKDHEEAFSGCSRTATAVKLWCLVDGDAVPGALQPNVNCNPVSLTAEVADADPAGGSFITEKVPATTTGEICVCGASAVPGGDRTELVISTASLFAKVARDACCDSLAKKHGAAWGFTSHKGYGTTQHLTCLAQRGLLAGVHRTSVAPFKANSAETARASAPTRRLYARIRAKLAQQASTDAKKQRQQKKLRSVEAANEEGDEGGRTAEKCAEQLEKSSTVTRTSPTTTKDLVTSTLPAHFNPVGKRKKRRRERKTLS